MKPAEISTPLEKSVIKDLKAGDEVALSGSVFTARDAAHQRFADLIKKGRRVPISLDGAVMYYCGPTPAPPRRPIGSCGPTTASRMDAFTEPLLRLGLAAMIGKGDRSEEVRRAIRRYGCVYFLATGGIGALLSTKVKSARPVLFKDLGPEAVHKLEVRDFPLIVGIDSKGNDIYDKAGWKRPKRIKKS